MENPKICRWSDIKRANGRQTRRFLAGAIGGKHSLMTQ
ncbi:hypothetical protein A2U01_0100906, partial [Trifolium medium]|nr:hypothetical protein [Trifolium medium]